MDKTMKRLYVLALLMSGLSAIAFAAGTSSSSWPAAEKEKAAPVSLYDQGVEATKNDDFQKAYDLFTQALQEDANNPDILNMLAHAQLKLGMTDQSIANYKRALQMRPIFPEAREYLGEAYIQAALQEIETIRSYGSTAGENLEDLVKAFKKAAEGLGSGSDAP